MDLRAVIMAGGIGTRFWPLSRKSRPKQFLPIISEKTMVEETVNRILPLIPHSRIYTIANFEQTEVIRELLPEIPGKNLLIEPQGKNTAPSLMLATAWVFLQNPEAIVAAFPSDQVVQDRALFLRLVEAAANAAAQGDFLVTFGVRPSYPATGYGYIHFSNANPSEFKGQPFYRVQEFKEKPTSEQAKDFLEKGTYLWNSGMFLWKAETFGKKLEEYAPELFGYWKRMIKAMEKDDRNALERVFDEIPKISIDYGLMEKAEGVLVSPGDFGWSDVGSWSSLAEIWPRDKKRNASRGECLVVDSRNNISYNPGRLTVFIGVNDLIVVNTEDALLICHRGEDQKVKEVVSTIEKKGKKGIL